MHTRIFILLIFILCVRDIFDGRLSDRASAVVRGSGPNVQEGNTTGRRWSSWHRPVQIGHDTECVGAFLILASIDISVL